MNHLFGKKKDAAAATPKTTDAVSNMAEVRNAFRFLTELLATGFSLLSTSASSA